MNENDYELYTDALAKIKQLEAKLEKIGKKLAADMVSKLSGDKLDRYLLKSTSVINKQRARIKELETEKQKLLDHSKYLHDRLDEMPCDLCEKIELKALEGK